MRWICGEVAACGTLLSSIIHILEISFCLVMQSKGMVGESQSSCTFVEVFGVDVEACGIAIVSENHSD